MKIEIKHLKRIALETLTTNVRKALIAILTCDNNSEEVDYNKFVSTILKLYDSELLPPLQFTTEEFIDTYKRNNTINLLPSPYVTQLPLPDNATIAIPSKWLLDQLPKVKRILEQIFTIPWKNYNDIRKRNEISLKMAQLSEEFFTEKTAENVTMELDDETPINPKLMKGLISDEVNKATKKLTNEITTLKKKLNNSLNKNRDNPSAGTKKMGKEGTAGGNAKGTKQKPSGNKNKDSTTSTTKLRSTSPKKQANSNTNSTKSKTTTRRK